MRLLTSFSPRAGRALEIIAIAGLGGALFASAPGGHSYECPSEVFLAYAPGGLEAMSILAFTLKLDPVFVSAHHLARYVFLSMAMPAAAAWLRSAGE